MTVFATSKEKRENRPYRVHTFQSCRIFPYWPKGLYSAIRNKARLFDAIEIQGINSVDPIVADLTRHHLPVYVTPHYHEIASSRILGPMKNMYDNFFVMNFLQKTEKIVCVSEMEKMSIIRRFGYDLSEKILIIPNGVDLEAIRKATPFNVDETVILYIGRIKEHKNISRAITAISYLPDNYVFYVIGEGGLREELESISRKLGLERRVRFLGRIPDLMVYKWLKTSSLLVNFSKMEAFGITVLEALAARKPALVNNKFGLKELAGKFSGGVFPIDVEKTKPKDLAIAMEKTSSIKVDFALEKYSWDFLAEQVENMYLEDLT